MNWYYARGSEQVGPLSDDDFSRVVESGVVDDNTLVWNPSMQDWRPYGEVAYSAPVVPVLTPEGPVPESIIDADSPADFSQDVYRESAVADEARNLAQPSGMPSPIWRTETSSPVATAAPASDLVRCVECGNSFPPGETIQYRGLNVCANCKPVFFQRLQEGAANQGMLPAGVIIRFIAKFLDNLIFAIPSYAIMFLTMIPFGIFSQEPGDEALMFVGMFLGFVLLIFFFYGIQVYMLGKYGATPGKMICGLRVCRPDGSGITYGRALGRVLGELVSLAVCYIGYIIAAFDDQKRALHDYMCDTRVIYK